ncbi:MAG TPA: hypothetical protein DDZ80_04975 [Cyanobacteria bacterium UBA8803]|nr:hypothetical protein [Cyanobacteria bacterium UBA9273]HBL57904.1 hypothetical protein [Cyanobacteria bacterium UBA8803]
MRQASLMGLVTMLALFMGGCPTGNESQPTSQGTPQPSPAAAPASPQTPTQAAPFANPNVTPQPANPVAVTGLLQTLPPEARVKQVPKGRTDPFAAISVQPEVTVSPNPTATGNNKPVRELPPIPPPVKGNQNGGGNSGRGNATPPRGNGGSGVNKGTARNNILPPPKLSPPTGSTNTPKPRPPASSGLSVPPSPPKLVPELPPLPVPKLAQAIEVTGVTNLGGEPQAIVKVPNEPSRYVKEGQRLSNGQVLVKRIEMNRGPEPVVILEQYGVEVARRVGEKPTVTPDQPGSPTASGIVPPPINNNALPQPGLSQRLYL